MPGRADPGGTTLCRGGAPGLLVCGAVGQVGTELVAGGNGSVVRGTGAVWTSLGSLGALSPAVSLSHPQLSSSPLAVQISATCPLSVGTARHFSAASSSTPPAISVRSSSTVAAVATGTTSRLRASASRPAPTPVTSWVPGAAAGGCSCPGDAHPIPSPDQPSLSSRCWIVPAQ